MNYTKFTLSTTLFIASSLFAAAENSENSSTKQAKKPNILFICVDDLRTELGCYGSMVKSPNLDRLAQDGTLFTNHYVQVPTSGASRKSLLTGHLPTDRIDISNGAAEHKITPKKEEEVPETMFHHLRRNGYYTVGIGKISHSADGRVYGYNDPVSDILELPYSWDEMLFNSGKWETGWNAFFGYSDGENRQSMKNQVKPYECADCSDTGLPDGLSAELALQKLDELSDNSEPFCLAVGFFKPHLPFNSPKKYWDMYDESEIEVSPFKDIPQNISNASLHGSGEFNAYKTGDEAASLSKAVSDDYARRLRHAYYACVSYTDAQIGKLLSKLEEKGLAENTIVVVWGDHGWNLGDMNVWGKHTILEPSLRSTLIVRSPKGKKGVVNSRIVSSVDIYPTLMELCDVDVADGAALDGKSFATLLNKPKDKNWEDAAYSYFKSGYTLRTPQYRLTHYYRDAKPNIELFKYNGMDYERENIAAENSEIVDKLMPLLEKGNTHIYDKK
ncbi:MAG: sulfatase [Rikenellaceae bacterium]